MNDHAWLTGPGPDGQNTNWPLDKNDLLIGREAPADIPLPLPAISRRHARITRVERGYYLADLGSRNGTFVNGTPVGREPQRLNNGDTIVLGGTITLHFHDPGATIEAPHIGRLTGIWLDEAALAVWVDGRLIEPPLSAAQFTLLRLLYQAPNQVVTRDEIIAAVWPDENAAGISEEALDGLIKRLRSRLRETQPQRDYLKAVRGLGLRLVQPDE